MPGNLIGLGKVSAFIILSSVVPETPNFLQASFLDINLLIFILVKIHLSTPKGIEPLLELQTLEQQ